MVMRGEYDRAYHQSGQMPVNTLTLGMPDPDCGDFRWCGKPASGGQMVNFSMNSGFDGACRAGFAGFAISFHHDLLLETLDLLELNIDYRRVSANTEVWSGAELVTNKIRRRLSAAYKVVQVSNDPDAAELFNFSAAAMVLEFLANDDGEAGPATLSKRRRAVRTSLEYLEDADLLPLTVSDLCTQIGVSAPTLYRAFQEEFGVSPKRYIQIRRLGGVRQQLLSEDNDDSIVDVANSWGFWHMGQFAADYRQHFGELPSETLERANGCILF
jgi:AraC-like DNA-binding protein